MNARRVADGDAVRAELLERTIMRPLAQQMQIEVCEHPAVTVRIVDLDDDVAGIGDVQAIIGRLTAGDERLEHAVRFAPRHRTPLAVGRQHEVDRSRGRVERANDEPLASFVAVRAEHGERIAMLAAGKRGQRGVERGGLGHRRHTFMRSYRVLCYKTARVQMEYASPPEGGHYVR